MSCLICHTSLAASFRVYSSSHTRLQQVAYKKYAYLNGAVPEKIEVCRIDKSDADWEDYVGADDYRTAVNFIDQNLRTGCV